MRRVEAILRCEGSRLQNEGLTLLLISFPADSTTVITTANVVKTCEMCKTKLALHAASLDGEVCLCKSDLWLLRVSILRYLIRPFY